MNKALLILLLFLQIGMANAAYIEIIGADVTWSSAVVSGPNPTISDRITVYDANVLSKFDVVAIPSDLSSNVRDRIIIYGANAAYKLNLVNLTDSTVTRITVTMPNGGENWLRGTAHDIRWTSSGIGPTVRIQLYKGGQPIAWDLIPSTPNNGVWSWPIWSDRPVGTDYKVKITGCVGTPSGCSTPLVNVSDMSDNDFTVSTPSTPSITVVSPNGGENWIRGVTKTINWTYSGSPGANVKIELLKAGILNSVINLNTPNDGSFNWTIPSTQILGTDYKVRITSTSNPAYTDTSNNNFIISSTSITVTYPNGGEKLVRGTTKAIRWNYSGNPGSYVKIDLLKGGVLNRVISSSKPIGSGGTGYYNWTIPSTQTLGSDYKIRVTSTSNSAYTDTSNSNFIISNPYITVGSPNGGESWGRGTTHIISWTSAGSTGSNVKIELFKSGILNRVISSSTPNDGSFSWVIPSTQTLGIDYKLKITSTSNSVYNDWSNSNFRIS